MINNNNLLVRCIHKISKSDCQFHHMNVHQWEWYLAPTVWVSTKFNIREFFRQSIMKIQVYFKSDKNNG